MIVFYPIPAREIELNWAWLKEKIMPALKVADESANKIKGDLLEERSFAYTVCNEHVRVVVIMGPCSNDSFSVQYMAGDIGGGPKSFIKVINEGMDHVCKAAKAAGAKEVRVQGRNWGRFLTGFRLKDKSNNDFCKVL